MNNQASSSTIQERCFTNTPPDEPELWSLVTFERSEENHAEGQDAERPVSL